MSTDSDRSASSRDGAPLLVDNPRSIRALAHPARLAIINALATGQALTATQSAELTGLSPSATAYHLKLLERYGFVEPASPRADGRERPWRATAGAHVDLDGSTPAGSSAASVVVAAYFDATRALGIAYAAGEHAEPEEWQNAVLSNADLWLTPEEFQRVAEQLAAVVEPLRGRASPSERPAGSRRVRVMNVVVPHRRTRPDPASGGPEAPADDGSDHNGD
jgi:DNA-binding transcriptional ArsR family regulator